MAAGPTRNVCHDTSAIFFARGRVQGHGRFRRARGIVGRHRSGWIRPVWGRHDKQATCRRCDRGRTGAVMKEGFDSAPIHGLQAAQTPCVTAADRAAGRAKTPDAIAVTCEGASLSYREPQRRANQLAHRLRALGVGPETLVAIGLDARWKWWSGSSPSSRRAGRTCPSMPHIRANACSSCSRMRVRRCAHIDRPTRIHSRQ
jgi:hypothetical protein